jgi:hypothetical protein
MYGMLGVKNNGMQPCLPLAALTTGLGRQLIDTTKAFFEKREYIFLAALYLLRDGLNVNEVTFIQRETYLNDILPNLHVLNEYGFDKGKYRKADKFLRSFFKNAVGKISLRDLQI